MATQLTLDWRDSLNDSAVGKMYVKDAISAGERTALLLALQSASDISIKGTNKITKESYAGSVPASPRESGTLHADDKIHVQLIFRTANPAEFVRVSVYGPKEEVPVLNDNTIDPTDSYFDGIKAAVLACVVSNSGSAATELMSGKLIMG